MNGPSFKAAGVHTNSITKLMCKTINFAATRVSKGEAYLKMNVGGDVGWYDCKPSHRLSLDCRQHRSAQSYNSHFPNWDARGRRHVDAILTMRNGLARPKIYEASRLQDFAIRLFYLPRKRSQGMRVLDTLYRSFQSIHSFKLQIRPRLTLQPLLNFHFLCPLMFPNQTSTWRTARNS